jgi:hypothetical protein
MEFLLAGRVKAVQIARWHVPESCLAGGCFENGIVVNGADSGNRKKYSGKELDTPAV